MDEKMIYPPKHYNVDSTTGILAPNSLPKRSPPPTPVEPSPLQVFEQEHYSTEPVDLATDTGLKAETVWNIISVFSAIFLGLGLIATCIVIPVYLVPLLSSTTTRITTRTTTTTTTTTTITTTTTARTTFYCAGRTYWTSWQYYNSDTIFMTVDTKICNFAQTPQYFTSIEGNGNHYCLTGYNAIYNPSSISFTIYARNTFGYNITNLLTYAQNERWNLNWYGVVV